MNARTLTQAQHNSLDRIAKRTPGSRVVGWSKGPIVEAEDGARHVVAADGRTKEV